MNTTIQVKGDTLERLKFFKAYNRESYDEVLNKLMDEKEEGKLTEEAIRGIQRGLRDVKAGRGKSIEQVAKELGIKLG
jgi:predicted CopG family antitoxin